MKRLLILLLCIVLLIGAAVAPVIFSGQTVYGMATVNHSSEIFFLNDNTLIAVTNQDNITVLSQFTSDGESQKNCTLADTFTACRYRNGLLYLVCSAEDAQSRSTTVYVYDAAELAIEAVYTYENFFVYDTNEFAVDSDNRLYFIDYYNKNTLIVYEGETLVDSYSHGVPLAISGISSDGMLYIYAQQEERLLYTNDLLFLDFKSFSSIDFPELVGDSCFVTLTGKVYNRSFQEITNLTAFGGSPVTAATSDLSFFCSRYNGNQVSVFRKGILQFAGEVVRLSLSDGLLCALVDDGNNCFLAWRSLDEVIQENTVTLTNGSSINEKMLRTVWESHAPLNTSADLWARTPCFGGLYQSGYIRETVITDGLHCMNFYRYLAGQPALYHDDNETLVTQMTAELFGFGGGTIPSAFASGASSDQMLIAEDRLAQSFFALVKKSAVPVQEAVSVLLNELPEFRIALLDSEAKSVSFGIAEADESSLYVFIHLSIEETEATPYEEDDLSSIYTSFPSEGLFPLNFLSPQSGWSVFADPQRLYVPTPERLIARITNPDTDQVFSCAAVWEPNGLVTFASPVFEQDRIFPNDSYLVELEGLAFKSGGAATISFSVSFIDLYPPLENSEVSSPPESSDESDNSTPAEVSQPETPSSDLYFLDHARYTLSGFPSGTTVTTLKKNLNGGDIQIRNAAGMVVTAGRIGTGFVIRIGSEEYTALLYGDANGDGNTNTLDMKLLRDHLLGRGQLNGIYFLAADINQDSRVDIADLVAVTQIFKGVFQ